MSVEKREFTVAAKHTYTTRSPVRWIASHTIRYAHLPIILIALSVVNNIAYALIQVFVGQGFDQIITPGWTRSDLLGVAVGVMASAGVQGITGILRNFAVEFLAQRVERDARDELYASLLGKSQTFHGRQRIGDVMARTTNDVRMLNMMFSPGLSLIIDSSISAIVPVIVIYTICPRLILVPVVFLFLLVVSVYDYNRRLKPVSISQREQFGVMNAGLTDAIQGIEVVKANVRERFELDKFTMNARRFRDYFVKQGQIQAMYLPMLVFSVCWAMAFFHGLYTWRAGLVTLGQAIAFIGLMGTMRFATLFRFSRLTSFNSVLQAQSEFSTY